MCVINCFLNLSNFIIIIKTSAQTDPVTHIVYKQNMKKQTNLEEKTNISMKCGTMIKKKLPWAFRKKFIFIVKLDFRLL